MKLGLLVRNPPSCCLPVGRLHQIVTCPKSFWSGDRLSDSPNCGRFLSHCSVVLSPLLTPSFMLEKYFQADWRPVCWQCWKGAGAVSVFAVVSLVWLQYFCFFCLYPIGVGENRFGIILSDLKWYPLVLLFLSPSQLFSPYRLQETSDRGRGNQYFSGKELQLLPVWSTQKCISTPEMQSRCLVGDSAQA